jgi:hypothetical protein
MARIELNDFKLNKEWVNLQDIILEIKGLLEL